MKTLSTTLILVALTVALVTPRDASACTACGIRPVRHVTGALLKAKPARRVAKAVFQAAPVRRLLFPRARR